VTPGPVWVAAFYAFSPLPPDVREGLLQQLPRLAAGEGVLGTVLIAPEGVNGTVCGPHDGVASLLAHLHGQLDAVDAGFHGLEVKWSDSPDAVFRRFKARRKREIVTMGVPSVDPRATVGTYVEPGEWNALINDPDTLVIDTRNTYEIALGRFDGALDPGTESFRGFPAWVEQELRPLLERQAPKRIAMYCTGGIRCEKASSYLQQLGLGDVHHLHGGILKYLETIPVEESRWRGECYVFDQRVAINHQLAPGTHRLCHACGLPLTPADRQLDSYRPGIQCCHCVDRFSDADRARFAERQRQLEQAKQVGRPADHGVERQ
jgi:UPF0176 protein